jgi:hypothetical protein
MKPAKKQFSILKQVCELIPRNLVSKVAKDYGVDKQSRTFTPWSHVVSMIFAQLSHALSLNDISDTLTNHKSVLTDMRRAVAPSRNGLSHANKTRNSDMAEALFWQVLEHLQHKQPKFGLGKKYVGFPKRFKRIIHVLDSSTIQLVSNCMDWAKHRRRKAAAKLHLRLDLGSFLPSFVLIKEASTHDSTEARILCRHIKPGEITLFDKAYIDFNHLHELNQTGIFWVTRSKDNMAYDIVDSKSPANSAILKDEIIQLIAPKSKTDYPEILRLVTAVVEIDGKKKSMTFLTNNMDWSASSICDLYKARWAIEVFFKQLKQTLQLADFLGYSKQAVRWQIWTALLTYLLLRFIAFMSNWRWSFSRIFTTIRGVLWSQFDLFRLLARYGTAHAPPKLIATPYQAYLPGFGE